MAQVYSLKLDKIVHNRHQDKLTEGLTKILKEKAKEILYFFGYVDHPKLKSTYPFVKFEDNDESLLNQFEGFK